MGDSKPRGPFLLSQDEMWWRDHYEFFLEHGYQLRPRFRPGWTPSWAGTKKSPLLFEDGPVNWHARTMDARRLSDGRRVMMKRLLKGSKELEITQIFSSEELRKDPRNHCVPILDIFSDGRSAIEFMVMPLLVIWSEPPFSTVDEIVDFMKQLLEGMVFIHEHGVAHRDCATQNIMLDGTGLFPKGFHPGLPTLDANARRAKPRRRRDVPGAKYYFIDFGISTQFDDREKNRLVTGEDGLDQTVPELHSSPPQFCCKGLLKRGRGKFARVTRCFG